MARQSSRTKLDVNQRDMLLPEDLMELGREMGRDMMKSYWAELTPEEKLNEFDVEPLLEVMSPEQRMVGLSLQDAFAQFNPEMIEAYLQELKRTGLA